MSFEILSTRDPGRFRVTLIGIAWRSFVAAMFMAAATAAGSLAAEPAAEAAAEAGDAAAPAEAAATTAETPPDLRTAYARLDAQYRRDLVHLSHLAYARNWSQLGDLARNWRPAAPASGTLLVVAPDQYTSAVLPQSRRATPADETSADETSAEEASQKEDAKTWLDGFDQRRREHAAAVFELAQQAAEEGQLSLAFQWATETAREDPDHADARRVLGYEQRGGEWLTSYGARMADADKSWHPRYGWIAPGDEPRFERGDRLLGRRWVAARIDQARRRRLEDGWQVRTDHFLVTTDHSLEAAAELAARLERLHQVWRQLFAGFYFSDREVRQLFAGERAARKSVRPFRVFYHRDRNQYAAALRRRQPRIAETLGIYFDAQREAHFFAGQDFSAGTLYHEAVHQLFQESRSAVNRVGDAENFWIIEGIATYFETLSEHADPHSGLYYTVGESSAGRLPAARERLAGGYYVPLAEMTQWGKSDLQGQPELASIYSQAAGLAAFFMDAEQGRYREPLVRYLEAVYTGRADGRTLSEVTGRSYQEIDAEYRRYMEQASPTADPPQVRGESSPEQDQASGALPDGLPRELLPQ